MADNAKVAVVMGSKSDWDTMQSCVAMLKQLNISYHCQIISAHRTPDLLFKFAEQARANGYAAIIAGAGGAAHLPGMLAAKTSLPVIGVPIKSKTLNGVDSLLSIVQMPAGIPVGTVAIGEAGAKNAALFVAAILANQYKEIENSLHDYRSKMTQAVMDNLSLEKD
ncbi:MAG: 5-(carboxyamino)imidazole ribonucleotide mutase [Pseudomonadota bacterium]